RLQFERDSAGAPPGDGELAGRIEFGDAGLHPVLLWMAGRPLAGRIGEFVVAPHEFEGGADLHLHLAGREPLAAQVALGEIGPDTLDRARQTALDLQRGRPSQRAVGVRAFAILHWSSPFLRAFAGVGDRRSSSWRSSPASTSR